MAMERSEGRAYIEMLGQHPGLAEAITSITSRDPGSLISELRDATDPAKIDGHLRAIIKAAQQARKALRGEQS